MIIIDNRGFTLLEVLITLAILSIIVLSFLSVFTSTNLTINYSGKKTNAITEVKGILDEINSKIDNDRAAEVNNIVKEVLHEKYREEYLIFSETPGFYKYDNKKIHCLIVEEEISIESSNIVSDNITEIKIILFYDHGKKKIELSTYIPNKGN